MLIYTSERFITSPCIFFLAGFLIPRVSFFVREPVRPSLQNWGAIILSRQRQYQIRCAFKFTDCPFCKCSCCITIPLQSIIVLIFVRRNYRLECGGETGSPDNPEKRGLPFSMPYRPLSLGLRLPPLDLSRSPPHRFPSAYPLNLFSVSLEILMTTQVRALARVGWSILVARKTWEEPTHLVGFLQILSLQANRHVPAAIVNEYFRLSSSPVVPRVPQDTAETINNIGSN